VKENQVSRYDDHVTSLDHQIRGRGVLRDFQRVDSANYELFQREIDQLTDELLAWRAAGPELQALDDQIAWAQRQVSAAYRQTDNDTRSAWMVAKVCGFLGVLGLLVATLIDVNFWLVAATVVFLGVAAGAVLCGTRIKRTRSEAEAMARAELSELVRQKERSVPARTSTRVEAPAEPVTVVEEPELEDVEVD
jgi:hypothetical protein